MFTALDLDGAIKDANRITDHYPVSRHPNGFVANQVVNHWIFARAKLLARNPGPNLKQLHENILTLALSELRTCKCVARFDSERSVLSFERSNGLSRIDICQQLYSENQKG